MPPKRPTQKQYPLRLPLPLYREAVQYADDDHRSLNSLIVVALTAYLKRHRRDDA